MFLHEIVGGISKGIENTLKMFNIDAEIAIVVMERETRVGCVQGNVSIERRCELFKVAIAQQPAPGACSLHPFGCPKAEETPAPPVQEPAPAAPTQPLEAKEVSDVMAHVKSLLEAKGFKVGNMVLLKDVQAP